MPLVRYEIRNEYSLAKPELYTSAARDDPDTLLEGVAMAGIVGIMRQLGDLAEFAAEIFHDLHEEVMATAAKGHELMVRVQQLEAEVPSIEKALMSETNQLQFAYTVGADWRANIQSDQIHLTQRDLPRFIWKSYEMCRGPPRLFVLDKFDVAGAGACLTRYTDPSFFRTEWANSQLRKAEKAQTVRTLARLKKKGRRRRNGETARISVTSQQNSRFHFSSLDLAGPVHSPGNLLNTCNQTSSTKQHWENEEMVHERMGSVPTFQSLKISAKDIEAERMTLNIMQTEQKSVLVNGEKKREVEDDLNQVDDIGSEVDNFMDARTSMESEIETDSECQINQEVDSDINFEHRETGPHTHKKLQKQPAESSVLDVQSSTCFSELSNDSSEVNACIQIYNVKCADSFANVTSCTASQDSFENQEPSSNLVSVDESTKFREEKSTTDLDSGNEVTHCLYSCGGNIVQKTDSSNVEAQSDHISLTSIATPADFVLAPDADFIQTGDAVLNRSPSFAFSNLEQPSGLASIHVATESGGIESAVSLDSSTHCENVANISSQSGNIAQTGHASTAEALSDNFDVTSFTNAADVLSASSGPVQAYDTVLDRSSSFAFSNFELSDVSPNATTSGRFDSADALFRFVTPELSIMYGDVKFELPILTEKLLATTEASAGVTDDKLETFSSDSERFDKSHLSIKSRDFNEMMSTSASDHSEFASGSLDVPKQNELKISDEMEHLFPLISSDSKKVELAAVSDASELASGFDDALMQDESSCVDLDADYAESEMPVDSDCCDKEFSEHENPSLTSAISISAQLKVGALYNESPAGNLDCKPFIQSCADLPSDSTYAEVHRSGMDIEPINELIDAVIVSGDALGLKSVQMNKKAADPRQVELPPDLQNVQVPVGYVGNSLPETPSKQISGDVLGEQLIYWSDSSKGVGITLEEDLNPDIFMKGIPIDLVQAELASGRHVDSPSDSVSSANDCNEQLDEFSKDEIEVFLNAEYVVHDTTSPVDFLHSRSSEESVDVGSHTFSDTQTKTELLDEGHGTIFHDVPTASSVDHTLDVNPVHMEVVSKPLGTDLPINLADEPHGIYSREGLLLSVGDVSANAYELSSPLEEDIKISSSQFALGTCPTMLSANGNYHPEVVNLEKSLLVSKITNLVSSFHVLTEHSSSVSRGVEEKSITDCVSLSSNNLEESSQIVVDEMQFSKLIDRDDGSECAQEKSFAQHSGSSNSVEIVSESAVFSGTMNRGIGSPRVPSNSASTNSSGASTPRDSILQRLDYCSVEEVYSGTPVGLSPGSSISTALPFSNSLGNSSHDMHLIATSQSMDIESELLVSSSLSAEPRFQRRNSQETPSPPPLPPSNWWMTKPREGSLQYAKLVESPAPPVLPPLLSKHSRPAQDPQSWKMSLERNDSLIRAIASYDKSMLRKVVRKTQSLKAKPLSEREELLHQIRTRSFSLRPTAVKKQEATKSVTNINVTAILEKASAIRQAFMGSEDDEDDDWSDS